MSKKSSKRSKKIDREIEIQVQVENLKPLLALLKNKGKLVKVSQQIDDYFTPIHRSFTTKRPVSEWLRIRREDGRDSVTYKNWYTDEKGRNSWCDEFETKVTDSIALEKIFEALDFNLIARVNKKRASYLINDYEVSIDKILNLGVFVEIEYKGDSDAEPKIILAEIIEFLRGVGVGKITRNFVGYPFMLLFPNEIKTEIL